MFTKDELNTLEAAVMLMLYEGHLSDNKAEELINKIKNQSTE